MVFCQRARVDVSLIQLFEKLYKEVMNLCFIRDEIPFFILEVAHFF